MTRTAAVVVGLTPSLPVAPRTILPTTRRQHLYYCATSFSRRRIRVPQLPAVPCRRSRARTPFFSTAPHHSADSQFSTSPKSNTPRTSRKRPVPLRPPPPAIRKPLSSPFPAAAAAAAREVSDDTLSQQIPSGGRPVPGLYWAGGVFAFCVAFYISNVVTGFRREWHKSESLGLEPNADVSSRYRDLGRDFDAEIDVQERFLLMGRKRRRLVSQARGDVLEVSVGTGRNMQYYDLRPLDPTEPSIRKHDRVRSITFNDQSQVMIDVARNKLEEMEGRKTEKHQYKGQVTFVAGDAGIKGVIHKPKDGFDTVVQTMGLCSMTDPVGFLRMMGELVKPPSNSQTLVVESEYGHEVEDDGMGGKILLLEHGHGHYTWLNRWLDRLAGWHADQHGCWWNRDIGAIVKESQLEVESIKRHHFGTTWEVVLRPNRNTQKERDREQAAG